MTPPFETPPQAPPWSPLPPRLDLDPPPPEPSLGDLFRLYAPLLIVGAVVLVLILNAATLLISPSQTEETELTIEELQLIEQHERRLASPEPLVVSGEAPGGLPGATAPLEVTTMPVGARVWINGELVGSTPLRLQQPSSQFYLVSVASPGFITTDTLLYLDDGAPMRLALALIPAGRGQQASGEDASPTGRTDARTATAAASAPAPRADGSDSSPTRTGDLVVLVRPWGSIYIDGVLRARDSDVSVEATLPVGTHRIRVEHPELGSQERTVEIQAGQTASAVFDLN